MRELRYISAQPAIPKYTWEVEVYLHNFTSMGIDQSQIDVILAFTESIPEEWIKIQRAFPNVKFYFYRDTDPHRKYPCAVKSHLLRQHFARFPELKDTAFFHHDCDFVFTKPFDFSPFVQDDNWYFSDTRSYLGAKYIESKGTHKTKKTELGAPISILDDMAKIFSMCPCVARAEQENTGGAQKLMKNLTSEYWDRVEKGSNELYSWLVEHKDEYGEGERNDIQVWTSDMWAELWTAWKMNTKILIPKEFDFCWPTDAVDRWDSVSFFHNAGVTDTKSGMFFKGGYSNRVPYDENLEIDPKKCSSKYYDLVKSVGEVSVLL